MAFLLMSKNTNIGIREKREREREKACAPSARMQAHKKNIVIIKIKVVHLFFGEMGFFFGQFFLHSSIILGI